MTSHNRQEVVIIIVIFIDVIITIVNIINTNVIMYKSGENIFNIFMILFLMDFCW